uniref:Medium-chain acyl-CoA ligase ACSF2, mitochondrial n=1 Tax=Gadus morhua TaxID=8049 RepID=A0A8C5CKH3_GADMO
MTIYIKSMSLARTSSLHVEGPPHVPSVTSSCVHGTSSTSLVYSTIGQCLQAAARRWPDREAVVFPQEGVRKTFAQFQEDVDKTAAGLFALGLNRGDRLGVWGPNTYEWILYQYATAKAGIIMVSVNPAYQLNELEYTMRKVKCNAVVCPTRFKTQEFCQMLREICPEINTAASGRIQSSRLPDLRMVIVTDSRQPGMLHVEDVLQAGESSHHKQLQDLQSKLSFDDPINIQFTSGTTGSPKGATLSHHNIINNGEPLFLSPSVRLCLPVPLYHCFGSVLGGMCLATHGITLVFPSAGFNSRANLQAIQDERCNFLYGTPTMFIDMLSQPDLQQFDLSSVEAGIMAGSPCPPEIMRKLKVDLNIQEMTVAYGTTETSPVTFLGFPSDREELKINTIGCIMDHTEAKVVDPSTEEMVPLGESGELLIRGYCVMLGYWDDLKKTSEVISPSRWYKTGDIASLNSLGYCRIEGRIKDLIIRGGENIYPAEIEQFLHTHPKVQDAQIAHFKIPHYVMFVNSFPLTVSGKIKKNNLREEIEKKLDMKQKV